MRGKRELCSILAGGACALALAACGEDRQDKAEKAGKYRIEISKASFPAKQSIADATTMRIDVHNADTKTAPNVAVTVATQPGASGGAAQAFSGDVQQSTLADASRPIWIVDKAPAGGATAVTNTWALGPLKAGQSRSFEWHVTAVKPGSFTIDYSVSPGLTGKAKPNGRNKGSFKVTIDDKPAPASVDDNGNVVRGSAG